MLLYQKRLTLYSLYYLKNVNDLVIRLSRNLFKQMLELSVCNSFFVFNNMLYKQKDGHGMGLPLSPTFANIFFIL